MKVYLFLFQNVNEIKNLWEFDKYIKEKSYNLQAGDMKINALSNATYLLIMCLLTKQKTVLYIQCMLSQVIESKQQLQYRYWTLENILNRWLTVSLVTLFYLQHFLLGLMKVTSNVEDLFYRSLALILLHPVFPLINSGSQVSATL